MEQSKAQNELSVNLIKEILEDQSAESIAGQLDEIIFQFIQCTATEDYGVWLTDRIWLLERLRNLFLVLTDGKMCRMPFNQKLNNV